jgi:hypothetical protein
VVKDSYFLINCKVIETSGWQGQSHYQIIVVVNNRDLPLQTPEKFFCVFSRAYGSRKHALLFLPAQDWAGPGVG